MRGACAVAENGRVLCCPSLTAEVPFSLCFLFFLSPAFERRSAEGIFAAGRMRCVAVDRHTHANVSLRAASFVGLLPKVCAALSDLDDQPPCSCRLRTRRGWTRALCCQRCAVNWMTQLARACSAPSSVSVVTCKYAASGSPSDSVWRVWHAAPPGRQGMSFCFEDHFGGAVLGCPGCVETHHRLVVFVQSGISCSLSGDDVFRCCSS